MEVRRIVPPLFAFLVAITYFLNFCLLSFELIPDSLNLGFLLVHEEYESLL